MAGHFLPMSLQSLWNEWNIRGFILLSLFLQLFLAIFARLQKKSTNRLVVFVILSAYFLADRVALFTLGMISNAQLTKSIYPLEVDETLLAFWAAFLLIHLGSSDTIAALSLEDNALWLRHLVGIIAQFSGFLYIFLRTLPSNKLVAPTVLVAATGIIKFGERVRALHHASIEDLKKSVRQPETNIRFPRHMIEAMNFFPMIKGMVVNIMPSYAERLQSREFFLRCDASEAFQVIEIEMDFLYEVFYAKLPAGNTSLGLIVATVTYCNVVAALILYCISKKDRFHPVDVWITYLLLASVFALETLHGILIRITNYLSRDTSDAVIMAYTLCSLIPFMYSFATNCCLCFYGFGQIFAKSWCQSLGAFNLLYECFERRRRRDNKLKEYGHVVLRFFTNIINQGVSRKEFDQQIWRFIFDNLKESAVFANDADKVKAIYESRGHWTLQKLRNNDDLMRYLVDIDYDKSLLVWHVATEICYNIDGGVTPTNEMKRNFAKTFSDYMIYLLIKMPDLMSAVAGIGHIRFRDTSVETEHFWKSYKAETMYKFWGRFAEEFTSIGHTQQYRKRRLSVLPDAYALAWALRQKDDKWELISSVWVELLTYAACRCRPLAHARALSQGGELITFVWLLMSHFGIGPYFPNPEDETFME